MKLIVTLVFFGVGIAFEAFSQVGVNSPNQSKAAILDIADNERGFLVPRLTRAERSGMKDIAEFAPLPQGLLVYDKDDDMFYYYNPNNSANGNENWQGLSPFIFKDQRNNIVEGNAMRTIETHKSVRDIYFFTNSPASITPRMWVKGQVSISSNNAAPPADYGLYVQGSTSIQGNVSVAGTVSTTTQFTGKGTFPIGGIAIWSGTTSNIPTGFALCNGGNGTPNLSDRFILASNSSASNVQSTGGQNFITLTSDHLPEHQHLVDLRDLESSLDGEHRHLEGQHAERGFGVGDRVTLSGSRNRGKDPAEVRYQTSLAGEHNHTFEIDNRSTTTVGSGAPFDNRPAFYVLAYIQRIN